MEAKIMVSLIALGVSFIQGYLFREACFRFIPFVVETLRSNTKNYYDGRVKEFLIRALGIITGVFAITLVLPGFLQFGVGSIMDLSGETINVAAKTSVGGWLFGFLGKALLTRISETKNKSLD